jgi:DNA-binding HxlR family transcriptional regulator
MSAAPPDGVPAANLAGNVMSTDCPSRAVLQHLTSRWGVLVLIALQSGTLRFSQIRRRIGGVSERMLAQTLRLLEEDGFVSRHAHDVVPPHVDYALTPLGQEAATRVCEMAQWIEGNIGRIVAHRRGAAAAGHAASVSDIAPT